MMWTNFVRSGDPNGRYLPVRTYNNTPMKIGSGSASASAQVVDDDNYGTMVTARHESTSEYGPWGGIPGIFAEFASEAGLAYDVHIEAISATTLAKVYKAAPDVIAQSPSNVVVLQEASFDPITRTLSYNTDSNPSAFCKAVVAVEQGIHAAAPKAGVYLYSTWAPSDNAWIDPTANGAKKYSSAHYLSALNTLTSVYHDVYLTAASQDGNIAGVVPVGNAWASAWNQGVANPNPYGSAGTGTYLTLNYQAGS